MSFTVSQPNRSFADTWLAKDDKFHEKVKIRGSFGHESKIFLCWDFY